MVVSFALCFSLIFTFSSEWNGAKFNYDLISFYNVLQQHPYRSHSLFRGLKIAKIAVCVVNTN